MSRRGGDEDDAQDVFWPWEPDAAVEAASVEEPAGEGPAAQPAPVPPSVVAPPPLAAGSAQFPSGSSQPPQGSAPEPARPRFTGGQAPAGAMGPAGARNVLPGPAGPPARPPVVGGSDRPTSRPVPRPVARREPTQARTAAPDAALRRGVDRFGANRPQSGRSDSPLQSGNRLGGGVQRLRRTRSSSARYVNASSRRRSARIPQRALDVGLILLAILVLALAALVLTRS